ncbi:MAG TPA: hypothetical protein VER98_07505, partial [Terriglobia bacterium]|nr:hypothetical protein [Terriglobia bacterium]
MLRNSKGVLARYLPGLAGLIGALCPHDVPILPADPRGKQIDTTTDIQALRRINYRAARALNKVDIAECIRNAMPIATTFYKDGDIDKLRIKEEACHYLAVALLQGLGRLDEAVLWWRERNRVAAAIAEQYFRQDYFIPYLDSRMFDHFWSGHIGHTALLGIHVKRNLLEGEPHRTLTLLRSSEPHLGNAYLVNYWQKYFTLADGLATDFSRYGSKNIFLEERPVGPETYYWQAYAEISQA